MNVGKMSLTLLSLAPPIQHFMAMKAPSDSCWVARPHFEDSVTLRVPLVGLFDLLKKLHM